MIDIVRFWHLTAETGQFLCLLAGGAASCFLRMAIPRIVPRPGNTCTTAWYIVYHGLVHRLPRPGTSFTTAWYIVYHVLVMKLVKPRKGKKRRKSWVQMWRAPSRGLLVVISGLAAEIGKKRAFSLHF
ncbi:MAG: hypothetical protein J5965_25650, partial [Aeriscardovia sp.]|nr:hypothetical protein [Aeriscardovia sp.]